MKIHDIKMTRDNCNKLLDSVKSIESKKDSQSSISNTKGGIKESNAVKNMNIEMDFRENLILNYYKNHQESGYTNYTSAEIDTLVSQDIFNYFGLERNDCRIDIKKFSPGKIHIPHKDYYINYKHSLADINGNIASLSKKDIKDKKVIRLWITLTEPKFGHILIIEDKSFYWLEQGTIITWEQHELHTAANLGYEDRFIMTITGTV